MDHMMPEMDGIETLERMNADRFNVNRFETPVIALTANVVSGDDTAKIIASIAAHLIFIALRLPMMHTLLKILSLKVYSFSLNLTFDHFKHEDKKLYK